MHRMHLEAPRYNLVSLQQIGNILDVKSIEGDGMSIIRMSSRLLVGLCRTMPRRIRFQYPGHVRTPSPDLAVVQP